MSKSLTRLSARLPSRVAFKDAQGIDCYLFSLCENYAGIKIVSSHRLEMKQ